MKNKIIKPSRKTIGSISVELSQKTPDSRDPIELQREMHRDYEQNVFNCVEQAKTVFSDDFFVVVETKQERLFHNVIRNYFYSRLSCPTPNYDQTVYRYNSADDLIEFLWVIPSRDTCFTFRQNILHIVPEERELLKFVLDFDDGTLYKKCKKFNGEELESILLEK